RLAFWSDQAIAEAESTQTGSMGGVPFGPGGRKDIALRIFSFPKRGIHGGHRVDSKFPQNIDHVVSKSYVYLFPEDSSPGPSFRRIKGFPAIIGFGISSLGQDPADNSELIRRKVQLWIGQVENFFRSPVKESDN